MIKIAIPSKGRLMEQSFAWFAERGISIARSGAEREYAASVRGADAISIVLLSASEVPRELAMGRVDLGVTGTDLVHERLPLWDRQVAPVTEMGFGHADLVLAVPHSWIDVETCEDLDAVAAQYRRHHGRRLRIATKYHKLVRDYLTSVGVADYAITDSQGATEGTVANGTAEMIADITSTGETLRANHLKILSEPPILKSQATLWRSLAAGGQRGPEVDAVIARLGL